MVGTDVRTQWPNMDSTPFRRWCCLGLGSGVGRGVGEHSYTVGIVRLTDLELD